MLKFENATNGRFYYIYIDRDIVNELVLRITYGGRNVSRTRTIFSGSHDNLRNEIDRISRKRLRRGYKLV